MFDLSDDVKIKKDGKIKVERELKEQIKNKRPLKKEDKRWVIAEEIEREESNEEKKKIEDLL